MAKSSSTSKVTYWTGIIREYRRSGLTQGRFCQEHGVAYHSLRWWLGRLREEGAADTPSRRKSRASRPKSREPEAPCFLPVRIIEAEPDRRYHDPSGSVSSPIQVLLTGGRRIAVGADFDPETLRRVIATLEAPGC
jgi:transposase-like protein